MTKFDALASSRLDAQDRLAWNNPAEIVAAVQVRHGARIAEIGCGTGWFTFELERVARPRGMVYALDMQPAMLQILRAKLNNYERILTLPCGENEFELDDAEVDVVFHANVLHECVEPIKHLREARRVLKNGGRIIVVEWHWADAESQPGPPNRERLEMATTKQLVQEAGFVVTRAENVSLYHYIVEGIKAA